MRLSNAIYFLHLLRGSYLHPKGCELATAYLLIAHNALIGASNILIRYLGAFLFYEAISAFICKVCTPRTGEAVVLRPLCLAENPTVDDRPSGLKSSGAVMREI